MKKTLIKNGALVDPAESRDGNFDILVVDGKIQEVLPKGKLSVGDAEVIDAAGCIVAPGFIELHSHLREPGFEYKETIQSGTASAVSGGYTGVCCMANTNPVNDNASVTDYILKQARVFGSCHVYPIGAITSGLKGEELASIGELQAAGCVAISDDGNTVQNAQLMRTAMDYAKSFNLPISTHSIEFNLAHGGQMNESIVSTKLGLKGIPAAAEEIIICRDINLARLTGAHLHVGHVSTKRGVQLIEEAKRSGVHVTCEVTPHHFSLTDESLNAYDTNYKMCPPLRTAQDVAAIQDALKKGFVIDAIATDHAPHGIIDKELEFDKAAWGIIGFETALPLSLNLVRDGHLTLTQMIELLSHRPSQVFHLPGGSLAVGSVADVVIFDPEKEWILTKETIVSKSKNSPFINTKLKGKVIKTIVGGMVKYDAANA